jgi:Icc-related predicted phosphoesterase
MKILCVSDWIESVIYSEQMKYRMSDVDMIISCGDIAIGYLDFIMSELNKPLYYVVGNHITTKSIKKNYLGQIVVNIPACFNDLHLKFYNQNGVLITGFQGTIWYNDGPFQYKQWEVYLKLLTLVPRLIYNKIKYGKYLDVFVAHSAPYKIGDLDDLCHTGLKAFNLFIKIFKPKLFLHGHIHIHDRNQIRERLYYDTRVINCSGYSKVEFDPN